MERVEKVLGVLERNGRRAVRRVSSNVLRVWEETGGNAQDLVSMLVFVLDDDRRGIQEGIDHTNYIQERSHEVTRSMYKGGGGGGGRTEGEGILQPFLFRALRKSAKVGSDNLNSKRLAADVGASSGMVKEEESNSNENAFSSMNKNSKALRVELWWTLLELISLLSVQGRRLEGTPSPGTSSVSSEGAMMNVDGVLEDGANNEDRDGNRASARLRIEEIPVTLAEFLAAQWPREDASVWLVIAHWFDIERSLSISNDLGDMERSESEKIVELGDGLDSTAMQELHGRLSRWTSGCSGTHVPRVLVAMEGCELESGWRRVDEDEVFLGPLDVSGGEGWALPIPMRAGAITDAALGGELSLVAPWLGSFHIESEHDSYGAVSSGVHESGQRSTRDGDDGDGEAVELIELPEWTLETKTKLLEGDQLVPGAVKSLTEWMNSVPDGPVVALRAIGVTPRVFHVVIEGNAAVAAEILQAVLRVGRETDVDAWFMALLESGVSFPSIDVVSRLAMHSQVPKPVLQAFVSSAVVRCESERVAVMQRRLVRLVCVLINAMLRFKRLRSDELPVEVESFCSSFLSIREASALYQALRARE